MYCPRRDGRSRWLDALSWLRRAVLLVAVVAACGPTHKAPPKRLGAETAPTMQHGYATWYGGKHHGGPTASGERFDKHALTAAHRTLPLNARVRVTNRRNGRAVIVRINDRGPYGPRRERIIDVSERAAQLLDMIDAGVVPVTVEIVR